MPVLNIPLGPSESPAGLVQAFPVTKSRYRKELGETLQELRETLGETLGAAEDREQNRNRLADFEAASQIREALLESTFSVNRLME